MPLSGSRTEFLQADALGPATDIEYSRSGGFFVTSRKALFLALCVLGALVAVGLLVHYLRPCRSDTSKTQGTLPVTGSNSTTTTTTSRGVETTTRGSSVKSTTPAPEVNLRLPGNVKPTYYNISLQAFIGTESDNFTFKGEVDITLSCRDKCESVTLHAEDLAITWSDVSIAKLDPTRPKKVPKKYTKSDDATDEASFLQVIGHSVDKFKDTITIDVNPALEPGTNYTLHIPFWANISQELYGFYRSGYTDENGNKRWLAATHFEATHARKAFPCFDEPAMKAQFEINIARRSNLTAVSNMPLIHTESVEGQLEFEWDRFAPSPIMSTYLVAFIVSDLAMLNVTMNETSFRVLARKGLIRDATYALDVGPRILAHYTDYFGVTYPLTKLDMAALPDFSFGAMENWGLVTYRESMMLYNANTSTTTSKESVLGVIAHELAHQWFGNLVTMGWWSDLWLNEGFATYVAYVGADHVEPSWNMLDKIVTMELHSVLETDSLLSTHPISVTVNNPAQISEVFDEVSYNKGACLIRMLNHSLTETVFRSGLTDYLNTWRYTNAKQDDLWAALTTAASNQTGLLPEGRTVKDVMDTWTLQGGYPVVTVTRDYTNGSFMLTQRRLRLDHSTEDSATPSPEFPHWYVPVSYTTRDEMRVNDTAPRVWLDRNNDRRVDAATKPGSDSWLLVNLQQTGYYRVNYDTTNWRLLIQHLLSEPVTSLPSTTRAQLINDALNIARAGLLDYGKALNLTLYLTKERELVPWQAFFSSIAFMDGMLRDTRAYEDMQKYVVNLMAPVEAQLGMTAQSNETQPQLLLRATVVSHMLRAESPRHVEWAISKFKQWANSTAPEVDNSIPVDLRYLVYCTGLHAGGYREWQLVMSRFQQADSQPQERQNLLRSLMCTRKPNLIVDLLERSLNTTSGIRLQDFFYVWRAVSQNPVATRIAFRYVRERWEDIFSRYGQLDFVVRGVIRSATRGLTSKVDLKDLLEFQELYKGQYAGAARTMAQATERLRLRVLWSSKYFHQVAAWLEEHAKTLT